MKGTSLHKSLTSRVIGFVASLILTLLAFFIVMRPEFFHLSVHTTIIAIFIIGFIQFLVQSTCFLNIWSEKGPRWNLIIFISTMSMIIIIIVGSIWIMNHLNYNMMP